jgi:carboxyl-terminal processing protease
MKRIVGLICTLGLLALAGCDGGSSDFDVGSGECSVGGQNATIKATMQEWYLFYDQLRDSDPAAFDDIDVFLDDLVAQVIPTDRFSYVWSQQEEDEFQSAVYAGFGFSFRVLPGNDVRLTQVFGEFPFEQERDLITPASVAGLQRGYRITAIEGISTDEIIANRPDGISEAEAISEAFGPRDEGVSISLDYEDRAGAAGTVTMTKEVIQFATVALYSVFDLNGRTTGYLNFRSFANPSFEELRLAFLAFNAQGVTNLVVDVRYNGGGLVSVAEYLGDLLLGNLVPGSVFVREVFNDKNSDRDSTSYVALDGNSLSDLERIVFITTGGSASASEMMINSMLPVLGLETAIVGSTTYGKPVGSYGFTFCDQVLRPVTFKVVNADNNSDYFDGFPPTCEADDDLDFAFGDPLENSLATALGWVETGACPVVAKAPGSLLQAQKSAMQEQLRQSSYRDIVSNYQ